VLRFNVVTKLWYVEWNYQRFGAHMTCDFLGVCPVSECRIFLLISLQIGLCAAYATSWWCDSDAPLHSDPGARERVRRTEGGQKQCDLSQLTAYSMDVNGWYCLSAPHYARYHEKGYP
jgi:hypothetical protein